MDISTIDSIQSEQNYNDLISAEVVSVESVKISQSETAMSNAKQFLDSTFPLAKGSHKDVSSYLVYYQQLLIFFSDGTHTGLKDPKQFVALNGPKSEPSAILLRDKGTHVELTFDRCGEIGAHDQANIEDIQIEGHRYWISLLNVDARRMIDGSLQDQMFTAKDGSDYLLKEA
ncbi:malate synthase [uncultured Shewanella sp.]|uniref:malate synthase n=1 Tax=Shewanella atlantica TaxID=271099 RepID=UPI00260FB60B|nr:malate synthase [uncultured Shewanella sp.]